MTNLATQANLEARLGRSLTATEATQAAAFLTDASALIRGYTNQTFTAVSADVVQLRPVGLEVRLPQRPVTAVNSVTAIGWAGIPNLVLPAGFWGWDGIDLITIAPFSSGNTWINLPDLEFPTQLPDTYEIDYDHGESTVPDLVVAVCCGMILRIITSPSQTEGMSSEHIGQYSYQLSQQVGGGTPGLKVRLSEADKDELRQAGYGPKRATTVQLRL